MLGHSTLNSTPLNSLSIIKTVDLVAETTGGGGYYPIKSEEEVEKLLREIQEEQRKILLDIINALSYKGSSIETIVNLKESVRNAEIETNTIVVDKDEEP